MRLGPARPPPGPGTAPIPAASAAVPPHHRGPRRPPGEVPTIGSLNPPRRKRLFDFFRTFFPRKPSMLDYYP